MDDRIDNVRHSIAYGMALKQKGVPVDMRLWAEGGHAFGVRPDAAPITRQWPGVVAQWLHDGGFLPKEW